MYDIYIHIYTYLVAHQLDEPPRAVAVALLGPRLDDRVVADLM